MRSRPDWTRLSETDFQPRKPHQRDQPLARTKGSGPLGSVPRNWGMLKDARGPALMKKWTSTLPLRGSRWTSG